MATPTVDTVSIGSPRDQPSTLNLLPQQPGRETDQLVASGPQTDTSARSIPLSRAASQSREDGTSQSEVSSTLKEDQLAQQGQGTPPPGSYLGGPRRLIKPSFREKDRDDREEPRPATWKSLLRVLCRHCIVHLFPVAIICVLLGFNFHRYYIGHSLLGPADWQDDSKIDMLQIAAKIHEISIIASLTTVVCDIICYVLSSNVGVPISAVDAGAAFSGGTYLLSSEFLKIFKSEAYKCRHKVVIAFMAILFCVVANSAGPSSAILMIPKNQTWPSANYDFVLNGTKSEDLWPLTLTERNIGSPHCSDSQKAIEDPSCIAGAYQSIGHYFNSFISFPQGNSFVFDVADALTIRTMQGNVRNSISYGSETWTMAPHAATVAVQEPIRAVWSQRLANLEGTNLKLSDLRAGRVDTTVPVVRTACVPMRNLSSSVNSDGTFPMDFPVLSEYDFWFKMSEKNGYFGNGATNRLNMSSSLLELANGSSTPPFIVKTSWVPLPPSQFGSVSAGLLILMSAAGKEGHGTRFDLGIGCAVDARWAPGQHWLMSSQSDWALAGYSYPTKSTLYGRREGPNGEDDERLFLPAPHGGWSPISLSKDWLQALTPTVPGRAGTSTLDAIFEDTIPSLWAVVVRPSLSSAIYDYHAPDRYELLVLAEHAVANLVADGVSRTGLHLQPRIWDLVTSLTDIPIDTFSKGNPDVILGFPFNGREGTTPLHIEMEVQGYAYMLAGAPSFFALAIMCIYLLIVVVHVVIILTRGHHTATWTTVAELLVRALSPHPPPDAVDGRTTVLLSSEDTEVELDNKTHTYQVFVGVAEHGKEVTVQLDPRREAVDEEEGGQNMVSRRLLRQASPTT
ncbi:uncharacterized protein BP5553_06845 [Venustampulla echinocandica]|uniref:Uncharacterized protein n=1 Tax=Venustampulla echinocandica TaxID=2656787 RepID=A0A370TL35_9HELO|nr:uncharacterized protein BP5553_06845 [Venustampulla echinocandica]RDL36233.1 hypothetical protein BP5553_06845 [Venustampulla echinocandica]